MVNTRFLGCRLWPANEFQDGDVDFSQLKDMGAVDNRLPEVEQFHWIARSVLRDRKVHALNAFLGQHLKMTGMNSMSRIWRGHIVGSSEANTTMWS